MSEQEKEGSVVIPIAATFADTLRPDGKLYALLVRGATFIRVPMRFVSANERARLDAENPDPFPPRKMSPQGQPYLDIFDRKHREECDVQTLKRLKVRVAALLPDEYVGTADRAEKIRRIFDGWSEADIYALDRQGANPYETREEGVQAQEERTAPFAPIASGESDA